VAELAGPVRGAHVVVEGLCKRYEDGEAVADASFEIQPGEFVSLLGPSGSGKTTTLMMIAGFVAPTRGDVRLDGRSVVGIPPHHRQIGVVFQSYALFPHMSVWDNVAFPLRMRRVPKPELGRRVASALEMVGLGEMRRRYPSQLSGGQQQRVALARALVFEPPLLLMDEPLGALDRARRPQMQLEIRELTSRLRISVLYVTHDQEEALAMSHRVAVMNQGRIVQIGTPREVYWEPRDTFVARFLGEANVFEGSLSGSANGRSVLVTEDGLRLMTAHPIALTNGDRAAAVVRPQAFELGRGGAGSNQLEGVVLDVQFLGEVVRLTISANRRRIQVRLPAAASRLPEPGARVDLSCPPEAVRVVPHRS
jgi:putative spermidine/putrescine transport system ATP-binding protein